MRATESILPIGGEMHDSAEPLFRYVTDSGRSSLRLILDRHRGKRFALPDFLCGVIVDTMKAVGVDFFFYRIKGDLTIDYDSLGQRFDALYIIDYFGKSSVVDWKRLPNDVFVLYDGVFLPIMKARPAGNAWAWFNSFRKISPLCDGSVAVSPVGLAAQSIRPGPAPFVEAKRQAKLLKSAFLTNGYGSEDAYLSLFKTGESLIDQQTENYSIAPESVGRLLEFLGNLDQEARLRQQNYDYLQDRLGRFSIGLGDGFKTLFVMNVDDRDALRHHLFERRIYLPVHWPDSKKLGNSLYERIISVPVDSRYDVGSLERVVSSVKQFMAIT